MEDMIGTSEEQFVDRPDPPSAVSPSVYSTDTLVAAQDDGFNEGEGSDWAAADILNSYQEDGEALRRSQSADDWEVVPWSAHR